MLIGEEFTLSSAAPGCDKEGISAYREGTTGYFIAKRVGKHWEMNILLQ